MRVRSAVVCTLLLSLPAFAATTIYSVTGTSPFGFNGQPDLTLAFQTTTNWQNVTITMPLEDRTLGGPSAGVEGTAYLTNSIGPGTTAANLVAPAFSISGLTASFTNVTLFTGLTLPPGTYYITIVPTSSQGGGVGGGLTASPEGSNSQSFTLGTGVTDAGEGGANAPLNAFPPATALCCGGLSAPNNLLVTVTGDPGAPITTPIPSSLILALTALAGFALYQGRRMFMRSSRAV